MYATYETSRLTIESHVGSRSAVSHNAGVNSKSSAHLSSARGEARSVGAVAVVEPNAFGADRVDVGRSIPVIAVASEVVGTKSVEVKIEYPH
jgi:hypothetical protein